jgi:hypothetical protein
MSALPESGKRISRYAALGFSLAAVVLIGSAAWAYYAHRKIRVPTADGSAGQATAANAEPATATDAPAQGTEGQTAPEPKPVDRTEPEYQAGPKYAVEPRMYDDNGYRYGWPGEDDCADKPVLWGDTLSGNPAPALLSAFAANWLTHYFPLDSAPVGMGKFTQLCFALMVQDKSVSCMYPDTLSDVPLERLKFNSGFLRAMLDLPDSAIHQIKASFDSVLSGQTSAPDIAGKLLVSKTLLEANPQMREAFDFIVDHHIKFDRVDWPGFIGMTYNDSLGHYFGENSEYFFFWLDRYKDNTVALADSLLARMFPRYAIEKAHTQALESKASSIFYDPPPGKNRPRESAVYFDPKSFIDPSTPPDSSRLDIRRKISRKFILASTLSLADLREAGVKTLKRYAPEGKPHPGEYGWEFSYSESKLSDFLFNSGSKYFDSSLAYYGFFRDKTKDAYAWEPIVLAPKLEITGYAWDDGIYDLGIQLSPYPAHAGKKNPILFAGIPTQMNPQTIPTGGRPALFLSRRVKAIQDSDYCRKATEIYAVPEGFKTLRSLFTTTFYAVRFESSSYIAKLEGQNRDGLKFAKALYSEKGNPDTTNNSVLQAKAVLYLVTASRDTVPLYTDSAISAIADGETVISQAARCRTPVFTDADGDGLEDLLFETSRGQVLFLQRKDGSFQQRIF